MTIEKYWLVLVLLPFLVTIFVIKPRIKYSLGHSQVKAVEERKISLIFRRAIFLFWLLAVLLAVFALMRPQISKSQIKEEREVRQIFIAVDVSYSMGEEFDYWGRPNLSSGITKIKIILKKFCQRRKGDLIGIAAYSGHYQEMGGAGIIRTLTPEYILIERGINNVKARMFGMYTATGEGLFVSMFGLLEKELKELQKKGYSFDVVNLHRSLEELEKGGSGDYALFFVRSLGKFKNKVIILFTDGIYNTGINPLPVLRLLKLMNIRVYFVAVKPVRATGVSRQEGMRRKTKLIKAVRATGGQYFDGENYKEVEQFFSQIDKIEKAKVVFSRYLEKRDIYFWPSLLASISFCLFLIFSLGWIKIP